MNNSLYQPYNLSSDLWLGPALLALEMYSVKKTFGAIMAVNDLTLTVNQGTVHGLLGPNGSGKSTTMKMILGLLRPDAGNVKVHGIDVTIDPLQVKSMIGYIPENPRLYEFLTGVEYLDFVADVYSLSPETKKERITEFLDALELEGRENEMISGYSRGMKQKIAIIGALLHRPRLLVMDEPLIGLDPRSAKIVKDLVQKLSAEAVTTIFSTHVLEIAEAMCDRITILYQGDVLSEGTVAELREKAGMPGSSLEDLFLKLTGSGDVRPIVEALAK